MDGLDLVPDWSILEAFSALAVRQGLLTVHEVQQQVALKYQRQDLPVLQVITSNVSDNRVDNMYTWQRCAMTMMYDWLVVVLSMKDVLKCATMKLGEQFVMMDLTLVMRLLSVDSWDTLVEVSYS